MDVDGRMYTSVTQPWHVAFCKRLITSNSIDIMRKLKEMIGTW